MPQSDSMILFEGKYSVRLEYSKDFLIVHLPYCNKFSKEVFQDMQFRLDDWDRFAKVLGFNGIYAAIDPDNYKMKRLLGMLEFKYQGHSDKMDVYRYASGN